MSAAIRYTVGREAGGRWIVSDRESGVMGIFSDRASAIRFAMTKSGDSLGAVWCLPENVTFNFGEMSEARRASTRANAAVLS